MNCIELNNITKTFTGKLAVDRLSLSIPNGSIYGFIGPNGSGKTTTLRMMLNIIYPDSGSISIFGESYRKSHRSRIGYLPEERGIYKKMKVGEMIRYFGDIKGRTIPTSRVKDWLERFELGDTYHKKVESLSKGMSQKVQFISTIIAEPELLILDEPFSGLDPVNTETMRSTLIELQRAGSTIVFSTHDMNTAERMCDRIFMIFEGKKVLDGTLQGIQNQYGSDTLRVRLNGTPSALDSLEGVSHVTDFGQEQELRLGASADPQRILRQLLDQPGIHVQRFEVVQPSLHDIFVRIAGPRATESSAAATA
ncbi:MAG: ATP-binding cassette domain-containing protein [Puniceicoccaceae bacterium]